MNRPERDRYTLTPPPLSLYVHLPWCVSKCPYCDFNSHASPEAMPADRYIETLITDLENDLPLVWGRTVSSVFIGGGTPSLFSGEQIERLLSGIRSRVQLHPGAEITLEANPGTVEHDSFSAYRDAGVNRVSLGVQSFDAGLLKRIGRIHGPSEAVRATESIHRSGIDNFNIDLMFGLPGQTLESAISDIETALACKPSHVSHYQLTLEPNTAFAANPPVLPVEDHCWEMQSAVAERLDSAGFRQYEISAWAREHKECRHNLNYWRYGDYLGIGAGAHAKITDAATGRILRMSKQRQPKRYLAAPETGAWRVQMVDVAMADRIFEFFLNQLRLRAGVDLEHFGARTGLAPEAVSDRIDEAIRRGLLRAEGRRLVATSLGWRFVNEIQQLFLP